MGTGGVSGGGVGGDAVGGVVEPVREVVLLKLQPLRLTRLTL